MKLSGLFLSSELFYHFLEVPFGAVFCRTKKPKVRCELLEVTFFKHYTPKKLPYVP